jgi:hypothetical protein
VLAGLHAGPALSAAAPLLFTLVMCPDDVLGVADWPSRGPSVAATLLLLLVLVWMTYPLDGAPHECSVQWTAAAVAVPSDLARPVEARIAPPAAQ